jgi:hypothetical protein
MDHEVLISVLTEVLGMGRREASAQAGGWLIGLRWRLADAGEFRVKQEVERLDV